MYIIIITKYEIRFKNIIYFSILFQWLYLPDSYTRVPISTQFPSRKYGTTINCILVRETIYLSSFCVLLK